MSAFGNSITAPPGKAPVLNVKQLMAVCTAALVAGGLGDHP
ncbi:hypothetical protein ACF07Q_00100 [Nocardiopsis dassonvillei]